jgi:hypothetical protein
MKKKLKPKGTKETSSLSQMTVKGKRKELAKVRSSRKRRVKDLEKLILDIGSEMQLTKNNPLDMGADLDIPEQS